MRKLILRCCTGLRASTPGRRRNRDHGEDQACRRRGAARHLYASALRRLLGTWARSRLMALPWAGSIHARASQLLSNSLLFDKTAAFAFPSDSSPEVLGVSHSVVQRLRFCSNKRRRSPLPRLPARPAPCRFPRLFRIVRHRRRHPRESDHIHRATAAASSGPTGLSPPPCRTDDSCIALPDCACSCPGKRSDPGVLPLSIVCMVT